MKIKKINKIFKKVNKKIKIYKKIQMVPLIYNPMRLDLYKPTEQLSVSARKIITEEHVLPLLKKESLLSLNINAKIDFCIENKKILKKKDNFIFIKDLFGKSFLIHSLRKTMVLKTFGYKKQFLYRLIDLVLSLSRVEKELFSTEIFTLFGNYNLEISNKDMSFKNILAFSIFNITLNTRQSNKNMYANLAWTKLYENFNLMNIKISFLYLSLILNVKLNLNFNLFYLPDAFTYEKYLNIQQTLNSRPNTLTLRNLLQRKQLLNFLSGRVTNATINNQILNSYAAKRLLFKNLKQNLHQIYKQGSFGLQTLRRFGLKNKKLNKFNHRKYKQELPSSLLYLITRLDEKNEALLEDEQKQEHLLGLRNFFFKKGEDKFENKLGLSLSTLLFRDWFFCEEKESVFELALTEEFESEKQHTTLPPIRFSKKNKSKILKIPGKGVKRYGYSMYKKEITLTTRLMWKQKKLVEIEGGTSIKNIDKYFSVFLGENASLIFINALALTKFAYVYPAKKKSAQRFLNHVEREMIQRYKYVAVYIQDFIRVCYLSFFLIKPTFLANFMGYQIAQLPRNRKETQFIRFLIKVIKIFGAQRREIVAVKIEFKGRVNRWRRTKVIRGTRGIISYFKFKTRIEFGSGKSITRKGALGIRLWICYKWTYTPILRSTLLGYIEYSQLFKAKTIDRFLRRFKSKLQTKNKYTNKKLW